MARLRERCADLGRQMSYTFLKGSSDLPRRMFYLYEGVRSSDRSTYMKGFQLRPAQEDVPPRSPELKSFHLYEGVPELRPAQEDVPPK